VGFSFLLTSVLILFFSFPAFNYMACFFSSVCGSLNLNCHVPCKKLASLVDIFPALPQRQSTETSSLQNWRWFRTSEQVVGAQDVGSVVHQPSWPMHEGMRQSRGYTKRQVRSRREGEARVEGQWACVLWCCFGLWNTCFPIEGPRSYKLWGALIIKD
jgi:hypothetical protein